MSAGRDESGSRPPGGGFRSDLEARAAELQALEADWDSYGAKVVAHPTLNKAIDVALALAPFFPNEPPFLAPCSDGSVQVEWHADGWEIECWVARAALTQKPSTDGDLPNPDSPSAVVTR